MNRTEYESADGQRIFVTVYLVDKPRNEISLSIEGMSFGNFPLDLFEFLPVFFAQTVYGDLRAALTRRGCYATLRRAKRAAALGVPLGWVESFDGVTA